MSIPPHIRVSGDIEAAKRLIPFAKNNRLFIAQQLSGFQNLDQDLFVTTYDDGTKISVQKVMDQNIISIFVPLPVTEEAEPEEIIAKQLVLVYGNATEELTISGTEGVFVDGESVACSDGDNAGGTLLRGGTTKIYGDFILCREGSVTGDSSGASATIDSCRSKIFTPFYKRRDILSNTEIGVEEDDFINIIGPQDQAPFEVACEDFIRGYQRSWSKTYDDMVLSAIIYRPETPGAGLQPDRWAVAATFQGKIIGFGNTDTTHFPSDGYGRFVCAFLNGCLTIDQFDKTHMGFDVWRDSDGDYFVGTLNDAGGSSDTSGNDNTFYLWKLVQDDNGARILELQYTYVSQARNQYLLNRRGHVRLLGYGMTTAYWADIYPTFSAFEQPAGFYEEDLLTGALEFTRLDDAFVSTPGFAPNGGAVGRYMWDPVARLPYIEYQDQKITGDPVLSNEGFEDSSFQYRLYEIMTWSSGGTCLVFDGFSGQDVTVVFPSPPAPNPPWFSSYTVNTFVTGNLIITFFGKHIIGGSGVLDKGRNESIGEGVGRRWVVNDGTCNNISKTTSPGASWCKSSDLGEVWMFTYENLGWIFTPIGIDQWVERTEYTACLPSGVDDEIEPQTRAIDASDLDNPGDEGWMAVLLHGIVGSEEINPMVVYKDLANDNGNLFVAIYGEGTTPDNILEFEDVGVYDRAFFQVIPSEIVEEE